MISLGDLAKMGPKNVLSFVQMEMNKDHFSQFNWLGLAEFASHQAIHASPAETPEKLEWAHIATSIRLFLIEQDKDNSESHMLAIVNLKVALIVQLGVEEGASFLRLSDIYEWFTGSLSSHLMEVLGNRKNWCDLPGEDIRLLRRLKNRINTLITLSSDAGISHPSDVEKYVNMWRELP